MFVILFVSHSVYASSCSLTLSCCLCLAPSPAKDHTIKVQAKAFLIMLFVSFIFHGFLVNNTIELLSKSSVKITLQPLFLNKYSIHSLVNLLE
jgi:hypothetical protein